MKKPLCILALISSLSPAFATLSLFDGIDQTLSSNPTAPGAIFTTTNGSYTLGSLTTSRTLRQDVTAGTRGVAGFIDTDSSNGLRTFSVYNGNNTSHTASVIYGGNGAVPMNLNLSNFGDAFTFVHTGSDIANAAIVTISIDNNGTEYTSAPLTLTGANPGGLPMTTVYNVPFSSFPSGANFTDVDQLTFRVNTALFADLTIASLQVVPEPSGAMLLSLVTGAFVLRRRRRA
jgi:hypothetical protein